MLIRQIYRAKLAMEEGERERQRDELLHEMRVMQGRIAIEAVREGAKRVKEWATRASGSSIRELLRKKNSGENFGGGMSIPRGIIADLIEAVTIGGYKKATKYISERETVSAMYGGGRDRRGGGRQKVAVVVKFGGLNHEEREFIKRAVGEGKKFPIKELQFRDF